jgi:hypothetical protein
VTSDFFFAGCGLNWILYDETGLVASSAPTTENDVIRNVRIDLQ